MDLDVARQQYHRWIEELWNGDLDVARELVSDDFVFHQATADEPPTPNVLGPEGLSDLVEQARCHFDGFAIAIEVGPLADGDMVAGRWVASGVYRGGMQGATAQPGTQVDFRGNDILRLDEDGRFRECWTSSDGLHLMAQLGAHVAPASA